MRFRILLFVGIGSHPDDVHITFSKLSMSFCNLQTTPCATSVASIILPSGSQQFETLLSKTLHSFDDSS